MEKKESYKISVNAGRKVLDISDTMYGIFFEDINRCADGGIYAEMVQNRSFECFNFNVYDDKSGENGASAGRNHTPLRYWYGDTDKVSPMNDGGLEEYFGTERVGDGLYYVSVKDGAVLYNRGFGGEKEHCGMSLRKGSRYNFSVFAKSESGAGITVTLLDGNKNAVGKAAEISVENGGRWKKYTAVLTAEEKDCLGQLSLAFSGDCCADMVSLFPEDVWGSEDGDSPTAHANYLCNPNYRLRKDLMQALYDMRPSFMRFPGGCISEGSFIWDNVYDWKDSVGDAAVRKENFNVWGYNMTMGLGYMEYFQMAEDLGAEPLPVMACGILCQARSDYVHPAGGKLREKYIRNFTDLVDFAVSVDFDNNRWARLRRDMGHEAPFGLHYLGIGNENWGDEFYADFEAFYHEIKTYIDEKYPLQNITVISTVGAQADDDAMKRGWNFLCGGYKGSGVMRFTDGETNWEEKTEPYKYNKNYLDTIADEHYYRSNEYLLENADRYSYYQRGAYTGADSSVISGGLTPKVFVGEYASTDKNTLRGAVAEAAVMTGFERNGDIVRMAATAPLFNQPSDDGTFRWTPDCIWFDKHSVFRTPTYFVQQMFMKNTGSALLESREYYGGTEYRPRGGFAASASRGRIRLKKLSAVSPAGEIICCADFSSADISALEKFGLKCSDISAVSADGKGLVIDGSEKTVYIYSDREDLSEYRVAVTAEKLDASAVIEVCAGLRGADGGISSASLIKYCVGSEKDGTGLKVFKRGKEGYTMGDFASSEYAGNLRAYYTEKVPENTEITASLDYGCSESGRLRAYYSAAGADKKEGGIYCRLEAQPERIYSSVTSDGENIYLKLVNAGDSPEDAAAEITGADTAAAELVTLSSPPELFAEENVNFTDGEKIVPVSSAISGDNGSYKITLPAQSVNILRIKKA